jgi:hypothetical protein
MSCQDAHLGNGLPHPQRDDLAHARVRQVPARGLSHRDKERLAVFFYPLLPRPRRHQYFYIHKTSIPLIGFATGGL